MNEHLKLVLEGIALLAVSGLPGLLAPRRNRAGQAIATLIAAPGCIAGLMGAVGSLASGSIDRFGSSEYWLAPLGGFVIELDVLTCVFLLPVFTVTLIGSLYGLGYWRQTEHTENAARLQLFYGLLAAAMATVTIARDGVLFLVAWEIIALAAFMLINTEDEHEETRSAAWLYLAASHVAGLALFAMFSLLRSINGSFALAALAPGAASPGQLHAVFFLALLGFGLKAGVMPLHVWLPPAHAAAPSHVSAIMSGVVIKMGIYGLVRTTGLLPTPPIAWGFVLLALGAISGIVGLAMALSQSDIKRALAYSSVENIGVIFIGLGLALCGRAAGQPAWVALGLGGALLHVWNHALFKPLLFFAAGSVIHATHTRNINQLGGLVKAMPWTSAAFCIGALGACALPPLCGFVSELLIYLGLFHTLVDRAPGHLAMLAFAAPALALISALSLALFAQLFGVAFLGVARSPKAERVEESPNAMLVPLLALVVLMAWIGAAPTIPIGSQEQASLLGFSPTVAVGGTLVEPPARSSERSVIGVIDRAVDGWAPRLPDAPRTPSLLTLAPLDYLSLVALLLVGGGAFVGVAYWLRLRTAPRGASKTWDCGYARPTARMQYGAAGMGQILTTLLRSLVRPTIEGPDVEGLFPRDGRFRVTPHDVILDQIVRPTLQFLAGLFSRLRLRQQGVVQLYLLYIFVTLVALLVWA